MVIDEEWDYNPTTSVLTYEELLGYISNFDFKALASYLLSNGLTEFCHLSVDFDFYYNGEYIYSYEGGTYIELSSDCIAKLSVPPTSITINGGVF